MTLTFERDLDGIKTNQLAKYLVQRLFNSKFIVQTHGHTQWTDCAKWTTKLVNNNPVAASQKVSQNRLLVTWPNLFWVLSENARWRGRGRIRVQVSRRQQKCVQPAYFLILLPRRVHNVVVIAIHSLIRCVFCPSNFRRSQISWWIFLWNFGREYAFSAEHLSRFGDVGAATVGVVDVQTPQNFGRVCPTPQLFWQLHIIIQLLCLIEMWGS